jgi:peptidoglycan-associated lipoprotein
LSALAVGGCANKKDPNTAADLGLGGRHGDARLAQDFTVNVGDRIFFDTDSSVIRADAQQTLGAPGSVAEPASRLFHHHGRPCRRARHARIQPRAGRPARGAGARLPGRRSGVDANRLRTISYGKERPVAVCDNISCWSQNRRAVTVLRRAGKLIRLGAR